MSDFNLGTVTAYGYAKDKGYTGTEDEFAALMASYADVAEQAAESAEQAAASATTATAKASEAAASATAAASSKTAAETAQGDAETAAQTATTKAGEATTAATTATNKATEATTAATTATGKATEAAGSATTATTKAGEASTSATNAAASATRAQEILDSIPEDYSQLSDDVSDLKDGLTAVEDDVADVKNDLQNGYLEYGAVVNGGFGASGPTTGATNRIRTIAIPFKNGDTIEIENGSLQHACGMWQGSISVSNNTRNDGSFSSNKEIITPTYDGYIVVVFRNSSNSAISPSDFDGSVKTYTEFLKKINDSIKIGPVFSVPLSWVGSGYIKSDGTIQGYTNFSYTDYIYVGGDAHLSGNLYYVPANHYYVGCYDGDYNFLGGLFQGTGQQLTCDDDLTLPSGTAYIRICDYTSQRDSLELYIYNNISDIATQSRNNAISIEVLESKLSDTAYVPSNIKTGLIGINKEATYNYPDMPKILWISDVHWNNDCYAYLKYFVDFGQYDALIISGDLNYYQFEQTLDATKTGMSELARLWNNYYNGKTVLLPCRGNHDGHVGHSDYTSEMFASALIKPFQDCEPNGYYYYDIDKYKLRLIMLNSCDDAQSRKGFTSAEVTWFQNALASLQDGWSVISVSHHPIVQDINTETTLAGNSDAIVSAIQSFVSSKPNCNFIAHLSGHTHGDDMTVVDDVNYVSIIDSSTDQSDYSADVICINQTTKTVNLLRSGQGSDRQFTY